MNRIAVTSTRNCRGQAFVRGVSSFKWDGTRTSSRCLSADSKAGAGLGNVRNQVLPTSRIERKEQYRLVPPPKTVSVIGAPMTYGQPFVGTDSGPRLLREAGLLSMLSALGWRVEETPDLEDLKPDSLSPTVLQDATNAKNSALVGQGTLQLCQTVEEKLKNGRFPLILGGDHSIGIGSLSGILKRRPNVGILWIDAHADLHNPDTSPSGNIHGMPLGMLMEGVAPDPTRISGFEWLQGIPKIQPESLVYVGLRDVDSAEREAIHRLGIAAFSMHDIDRYGIGTVMEMALHHLLKDDPDRPLHMSYDIDAVDPVLAPATGTTVRGGLTFREAHYVAEAVAESGNLTSMEIVELNPSLSPGEGAEETVELGLQILTSSMGKSIL